MFAATGGQVINVAMAAHGGGADSLSGDISYHFDSLLREITSRLFNGISLCCRRNLTKLIPNMGTRGNHPSLSRHGVCKGPLLLLWYFGNHHCWGRRQFSAEIWIMTHFAAPRQSPSICLAARGHVVVDLTYGYMGWAQAQGYEWKLWRLSWEFDARMINSFTLVTEITCACIQRL